MRDASPEARLRRAGQADAAAILAVLRAAFSEHEGRLAPPSGALSESVATIERRLETETCLVAERDGRLVAAVFYKDHGDHLYFGRLSVRPEWRGRGLARRMIAAIEAAGRAAGIDRVALNVRIALPGNIAFFVWLGYREVARETHAGFSAPTSLRLEKRLGRGVGLSRP